MKKHEIGLAHLQRFKGCCLVSLTGGGVFLFVSDVGGWKKSIWQHQKDYSSANMVLC